MSYQWTIFLWPFTFSIEEIHYCPNLWVFCSQRVPYLYGSELANSHETAKKASPRSPTSATCAPYSASRISSPLSRPKSGYFVSAAGCFAVTPSCRSLTLSAAVVCECVECRKRTPGLLLAHVAIGSSSSRTRRVAYYDGLWLIGGLVELRRPAFGSHMPD